MNVVENPSSVRWQESAPECNLPPLDESLSGWTIDKTRASHLNARRTHRNVTFHLKWFYHGICSAPARTEWRNALKVASLGLRTVEPAGWGTHPKGSFVALVGSPGFPADQWRSHGLTEARLCPLAGDFAQSVSRLHRARLCHRDLNVYHVLIHRGILRLLDVGRVRSYRRRRWIIKDLAILLDSARFERLPTSVMRVFFRRYCQESCLSGRRRHRLLRSVITKARRYRRHNEKHGR